MHVAYAKTAQYYDLLYAGKDYEKESKLLINVIKKYKQSKGNTLLEVACGTGRYLEYLRHHFECTGSDVNADMLRIAKKRVPHTPFKKANMISLSLGKTFDVVLCLFSSIGYVRTYENLKKTIRGFERHLKPGGVLVIDPWCNPTEYKVGSLHGRVGKDKENVIAQVYVSKRRGNLSIMDGHTLLLGKNGKVKYFVERYELALFDPKKVLQIMNECGLKARFSRREIQPHKGLYIAAKPLV